VWICPDPDGHLQAVGTDAAGRRQYRYHDRWRARRDREKFDHMLEFARALPRIRRVAARDLRREGVPRERVLACAVRLLDLGFFRIGGEEYADENGGYGLATLERRHVTVRAGGVVEFDYVSKAGRRRRQDLVDPDVHAVVATLKRRRSGGDSLLAYRNGRWVDVHPADVNEYLRAAARDDVTAKDFRTWHATVLAAVGVAVSTDARTPTARKRAVSRAVAEVAGYLGNTPAVCRASYIDPRVFDRYRAGATIAPVLARLGDGEGPATQGRIEAAVIDLLDEGRQV
jgi:DNA topoisomerase IB